jgi:hypothetical protein
MPAAEVAAIAFRVAESVLATPALRLCGANACGDANCDDGDVAGKLGPQSAA